MCAMLARGKLELMKLFSSDFFIEVKCKVRMTYVVIIRRGSRGFAPHALVK